MIFCAVICAMEVEESLKSNDILLNIPALVDRRVGEKINVKLAEKMKLKQLTILLPLVKINVTQNALI